MEPQIKIIPEKILVGKRMTMSFTDNKTPELWKNFMPERNNIKNNIGKDLYSLQIYSPSYFNNFNPSATFEKWALVEVSDHKVIPDEMEAFNLKEGLYAVFHYKGLNTDTKIFEYIYGVWLPNSQYTLDNRPHFEILGERYKNGDPNSEEEIWIPIKIK